MLNKKEYQEWVFKTTHNQTFGIDSFCLPHRLKIKYSPEKYFIIKKII